MSMDPRLSVAIRLAFDIDVEPIPPVARSNVQAEIVELLFRAGARKIERVQNPNPTLFQMPSTTELVREEPPKRFRGLRDITERLRPVLVQAVPVDVAGFDYASACEYGIYNSIEGEVAQAFFFWTKELYVPNRQISDERVVGAISNATDRIDPLLDSCGEGTASIAILGDAVPHGWRFKRLRWLVRDQGRFRAGIHCEPPEDGIGIRGDGMDAICRFFVSEYVRELVTKDAWLLAGPGQAVLVTRSADRLDDYAAGMKCGMVSGNIWRNSGEAEDPETAALVAQHQACRRKA